MSTPTNRPSSDRPVTRWIVHHFTPLALIAAVLQTAMVTGLPTGASILWHATAAAGVTLPCVLVICIRRHEHMMCIDCARRIPACPADAVARHHRALQWTHWAETPTGAICRWVVFGVLFIAVLTGTVLMSAVAVVALFTLVIRSFRAEITHQILWWWCPYCRRGGGGDDTVYPQPLPTGESVRT